MSSNLHAEVVVLGSGPGGYSAAFRAADLGKKVILIERYDVIGGVCLNVGCIPSKALLHLAKIIDESADVAAQGVEFAKPKLNFDKMRDYKNGIIKKLTGGLSAMAKQRQVQIVKGEAQFSDSKKLIVDGKTEITFDNCIIAAGSLPVKLPFVPEDPRVLDSTSALELEKPDAEMLILGGGIIGLEMATVYHALGAEISFV